MKFADLLNTELFPILPKFLADYFYALGIWDLSSGQAQYGYLGARFINVFGADAKLVFSPFGWLMGAGVRGPVIDVAMGLGDDVTFCYGSRIRATYGGPVSEIIRGPQLRKVGGSIQTTNWLAANPALGWGDKLSGVFDLSHPAASGARDIVQLDNVVKIVVGVLGALLATVTATIEYVVRYGYGKYDDNTGQIDVKNDPSKDLKALEWSHRMIPRRVMALIYHIETAGTMIQFARNLGKNALALGEKLLIILGLPFYAAKNAYEACAARGKKVLGALLALLVLAIFLLVVLLIVFKLF